MSESASFHGSSRSVPYFGEILDKLGGLCLLAKARAVFCTRSAPILDLKQMEASTNSKAR